jgi:nucleoside-diphosphate-sugar epimerase
VVLHFAAHGAYERQSDARAILQTDILGSFQLLEASRASGAALFVNAGSSSEYGFKDQPMAESDRLDPNSVYAVAKAAQTHLASLLGRAGGMAVVTFRLFSVYGPWEDPGRLIPTLLRRAKAGLALEMASPDSAHDFVYVDDVLDAMLDFGRLAGLQGEVLNLGTGVQSTLRDAVGVVQEVVGTRSEVRWGALPSRRWDSACWQADITRTRAVLGWQPRASLPDGVRRMSEWMDHAGPRYAQA